MRSAAEPTSRQRSEAADARRPQPVRRASRSSIDVTFGFCPGEQSVVPLLYDATDRRRQRGPAAGAAGPLSWFFSWWRGQDLNL